MGTGACVARPRASCLSRTFTRRVLRRRLTEGRVPGAPPVAGSSITGAPNHDLSKPWDAVRLVLYSMLVEAPSYMSSQ